MGTTRGGARWSFSPATPLRACSSAASVPRRSKRSSTSAASATSTSAGARSSTSTRRPARASPAQAPSPPRRRGPSASRAPTRSLAPTAPSSPSATASAASRAVEGKDMTRTIIVAADEQIACPKCSHRFALSDGLSRQAIERHAGEFERALAERGKKLEAQLAAEAKAQFETREKALNEALGAKDAALSRFRSDELALRRQLREMEDAKKNQDLDYQRRLDAERKTIEDHARSAAGEDLARREAQWKAQLDSALRKAADLERKLEQGSQQLQGEAFELSLEALLKGAFPLDEIVPVAKGVNGADLIQRVRSPSGLACGTILWEAKQTKAWQPAWLRKLKDEQQAIGAELAVIVTATMPRDAREPFLREADVWVARFDAARPLAEALRALLIEVHRQRQANLGRSEKVELLYNYLCSPQFTQRMKSVVEGFAAMRQDLEAEKMAFARIWKKREAQLGRMSDGLLGVVGDLQAIGQETLPQLESIAALPVEEEIVI